MYEKATMADLSIVVGVMVVFYCLLTQTWWTLVFYSYLLIGIFFIGVGFGLDRIREKRKREVDIDRMAPRLPRYLEDAQILLTKGAKALSTNHYSRALDIYTSAVNTLTLAEEIAKKTRDSANLEQVTAYLTEARTGIAGAHSGIATTLTNEGSLLYTDKRYEKALEKFTEALDRLTRANETEDMSTEIKKVNGNIHWCKQRLAEKTIAEIEDEVESLLPFYDEYLKRVLLIDARELLNDLEVKLLRAHDIAQEYEFLTAMEDIDLALERIRGQKDVVGRRILENLKATRSDVGGISEISDRIDPGLKKVAVNVQDDLEVISGYDFRNGGVRVQYTFTNTGTTMLSNINLKVIREERFLDIVQVFPDYPIRFNDIQIGQLGPNKERRLSILMDPQICGNLNVDSNVTYHDAKGELRSIIPERKVIDIPEPVIGSKGDINSTYLNALISEARHVGRRSLSVPSDVDGESAFLIVEEVVDKMGLRNPFKKGRRGERESFYGIIEEAECAVVISLEDAVINFDVASDEVEAMTFLMTSLSKNLRERFAREGHKGVTINLTIQDSVLYDTSIVIKTDEETVSMQDVIAEKEVSEENEEYTGDMEDVILLLKTIDGVDGRLAPLLAEAGFTTVKAVANSKLGDLRAIKGIGQGLSKRIHDSANEMME